MAKQVIKKLIERNFSFFTGVPCSLLADYFYELEQWKNDILFIPALREDIAIGIAAGSTLAGRKAVILMQNSGLGLSINALASLVLPFDIAMLLIISVRGYDQENDTVENAIMGSITLDLLNKLNIEAKILEQENTENIIEWAYDVVNGGRCAAILVVNDGKEI